jgi:glutaminase
VAAPPLITNLAPNTILMGERAYEQALDYIIQQAQKSLLIFDQDLSKGSFSSLARAEMLHHFLAQQGQLTMVLHETDYFTQHCPRLNVLLHTYGHAMRVFATNEYAKIARDHFVIADGAYYLKRFHTDQARFKFSFDDMDAVSGLTMRFEELLAQTSHVVSTSHLGL